MRRAWVPSWARLVCAVAGCAVLAGCSGLSSSSSTSDPPAPATTATTATTTTATATTTAPTSTTAPGSKTAKASSRALPVSNASPSVVQRQPPAGSCHARGSGLFSLPDPRCTPGAVSPAVTEANIHSTICRRGYTESVRPPESVTEPEKRASLVAYGDTEPLHEYEYDHLVPLELGGAVNDPRNLWPEPGASPNPKDALEDHLRSLVCDGSLTLAAARREIATDWVSAYRRLIR